MDARQGLGQIAVALVGDNDARAGFGDEEVGARDPDIGGQELRPQQCARFVAQCPRLGEDPLGIEGAVAVAEGGGDLILDEMHRRRDQMARRLPAQLDDVFTKIGLDRGDAVVLEEVVEPDLLGDHRLALGDDPGADGAADAEHSLARLLRCARPVDLAAGRDHVLFIELEVEIEVCEGVVFDLAAHFAQRLEFRKPGGGLGAAQRKPALRHDCKRVLQLIVGEAGAGVRRKFAALRLHLS